MSATVQRGASLCLGEAGEIVGQLRYTRSGSRESSSFVYDPRWLQSAARFPVSPDLAMGEGRQFHKAAGREESVFHLAIADTEPEGWGRRVIARGHAKRRRAQAEQGTTARRWPH